MSQTNLDATPIKSNDSMAKEMSEREFRMYIIKKANDEMKEQMQALNDRTNQQLKEQMREAEDHRVRDTEKKKKNKSLK